MITDCHRLGKIFLQGAILTCLLLFQSPILLGNAATTAGPRCFVNGAANGADNGSSWADAYKSLQSALGTPDCTEIWVAQGIYKPTSGIDRSASFSLASGVAIYGGFLGTETNLSQRNWQANATVLSGNIGAANSSADNSHHVVVSQSVSSTAILNGFTITAGNANDDSNQMGGGLYNYLGSPTLSNLIFTGNSATRGGGFYNRGGNLVMSNLTFSLNLANWGAGLNSEGGNLALSSATFTQNTALWAGGMVVWNAGISELTNITFTNNVATYQGGGLAAWEGSNISIIDSVFNGNSSGDVGGGMYIHMSSPTLQNVMFTNNTAVRGGGLVGVDSSPTITDITFADNHAQFGAGVSFTGGHPSFTRVEFTNNAATEMGGGMISDHSDPTLTDSSFTGNSAIYGGGFSIGGGSPTINNVVFTNNSANNGWGGGIYAGTSSPTLRNVTFEGNSARWGGGMNNYASVSSLTNVVFHDNTANFAGGLIVWSGTGSTLTNATISHNTALEYGGGVVVWKNSSLAMANTILWNNLGPAYPQVYIESASLPDTSGAMNVSHSLVENGCPIGATCDSFFYTTNPHFVDPAAGNFRLQSFSPAVDAGNNAALQPGVVTDLDGNPRFMDIPSRPNTGSGSSPHVDLGAYEVQVDTAKYVYIPAVLR